jgi:hypothetical protein
MQALIEHKTEAAAMARRSEFERLRMTDLAGPAALWALSLVVAMIAASTPAPTRAQGASAAQAPVVVASRR